MRDLIPPANQAPAPAATAVIAPNDSTVAAPEPLLRPPAAAKYLAIGQRTLERLVAAGKIPFVRMGRMVRYDPKDLRSYVERCKQGG